MNNEVFHEGRRDRLNDYGRRQNPYLMLNPKHQDWNAGWDSAERDYEQSKQEFLAEE